jgi:hypothetical protein
MSSTTWICWLKGHLWHFYNGHTDFNGAHHFYCCERCGKRR